MTPYFLSLLITSYLVYSASAANLVLLLQRTGLYQYNLTCVASAEYSKYALLWTVYDSENTNGTVLQDANENYIDKFETADFITNAFKKNILRPINYNLPGVIDRRWEDFKLINTYTLGNDLYHNIFNSYTGNASLINISILFKKYMILQLVTEEGIFCVEIRKHTHKGRFSTCEIIATFFLYSGDESEYTEEWNHFRVYKRNGEYILESSKYLDEPEEYELFQLRALTVISESASIWKVHDYSFLRIDQEVSTQVFTNLIRKPRRYEKICLAFFLFMEKYNCQVAVTLCDRNCRKVYATKTFSNGGKWTEERIYSANSDSLNEVYVFIKKSPNCTFAAVDDFRHCSLNENRILNIKTDNYKIGCLSLSQENNSAYYRRPVKKNVMETNEALKILQRGHVICEQESCYCPNGFKGDWCDEDPETTVRIEEVAATSANLIFETDSHYSTLQIDLNRISMNNITVDGRSYMYQFWNLSPVTTYNFRARFCSLSSCTHYISSSLTTKACHVLTGYNIQVTSSTFWFTLKLVNFNNYTCPPNFFEVINGTDSRILQNTTMFNNLQPYHNYNVDVRLLDKFKSRTLLPLQQEEYSFTVSTQTVYSVPDEVCNIRETSISPTEVIIDFDPPIENHFIHSYMVSYWRIASACGDVSDIYDTIYNRIIKEKRCTLSDLHPYSIYNVSIRAKNDKGIGAAQTYIFRTLAMEHISNEEMFIDLSGTVWKFPSCEVLKGPLQYKLVATCMEEWCSGSLNETLFEIYKDVNKANEFIRDLPSYCHYNITVKISRNGSNVEKYLKNFSIFTPPGKPHPVTDLKVYTINKNSLALKFRPPFPPTGAVKYDFEVSNFQICDNTVIVKNCSLWDGLLCADIGNLTEYLEYVITIWTKNHNVSAKSRATIQTKMEQTAPEAPGTLRVNTMEYCRIQLEWDHPLATNGPLKYFIVTVRENETGNINTVEIIPKEELRTYFTELLDLRNNTVYKAYVEAHNLLKGEPSNTITFETCSGTSKIAWISIFVIVLLIIFITAAVALVIIIRRRKTKEENVTLWDISELQHLNSSRKNMVFAKKEFSAEIEKNLNFEQYDRKLLNEYVDLPDTKINVGDVINVKGMNGYDTYISCKSPTSDSINTFWDSIWNERVNVIICFQTLEENESTGIKYWPEDDDTFSTENINITCDSVQGYSDFFVRILIVSKEGEIDRKIKHLNFISYPPDDIPTFPFSYIIFLSYVKSLDYIHQKMMVHCSDGANRTGVFIMCYDFLHNQTDVINVAQYLEEMRKSNPLFINDIVHYRFVYFAIHEILTGRLTDVPENTFLRHYETLYADKLEDEFNYIAKTKFVYSMLRFAVPEEPYRLETSSVAGYQGKTMYWTTRYLGMNKKNLWKFIKERDIKVIVMLQNMGERCREIWPINTQQQINCRGIKVTMETCLNKGCYKLIMKANGMTSDIRLLYFQDWSADSSVPPDIDAFYTLYNLYETIKTGTNVLLCCENGFTACGIFACFDLVLHKLKFENVFDLCWAVRSINYKNDVFLDIIEQHQFIYSTILYYLEQIQTETEDFGNIYQPLNIINEDQRTSYDLIG